jgi:hypothetical protein
VWLLLLILGVRIRFLRGLGESFGLFLPQIPQCSNTYRTLRFKANKLYKAGIPQVLLPAWYDCYDYATRVEYLGIMNQFSLS